MEVLYPPIGDQIDDVIRNNPPSSPIVGRRNCYEGRPPSKIHHVGWVYEDQRMFMDQSKWQKWDYGQIDLDKTDLGKMRYDSSEERVQWRDKTSRVPFRQVNIPCENASEKYYLSDNSHPKMDWVKPLSGENEQLCNDNMEKSYEISQLKEKLKQTEVHLEEATRDIQKKENQIQQKRSQISELQNEIKKAQNIRSQHVGLPSVSQRDKQNERWDEKIAEMEEKERLSVRTIQKLRAENNSLKKDVKALQERVSSSDQSDDKYAKMITELAILKGREKSMEEELLRLQKTKAELQTELDEKEETLGKLCNEKEVQNSLLRKKDQAIEDLTKRLSSEMNTKISSDESSLENVSIKDRPMNIATEYDLLCSNEWLAAKTALDELLPDADEELILKFLCGILTTALTESCKLKQVMLTGVKKTIYKPGAQAGLESDKVPGREVPENLMQQLMDLLRKTVEDTDLTVLFQAINTEVGVNSKSPFTKSVIESEKMAAYIKATGVVTWKMVLQRPEMTFRQDGIDGKYQGEKKQEVFWKSSDPSNPNSNVKFYVQPALYHGDAMMVKGRVFLSTE